MGVLLRVIVKEFLQLRQDKRMIPVIFVAPVIQLVIFGFAVNTDVTGVPLLLVDQDRSAASRALADRFVSSGYFALAGTEDSVRTADPWLVTGRAQAALVIGAGYGEAMSAGRTPRVQMIADGSDASPTTVALGYASAIVSGESRARVAGRIESLLRGAAEGGADVPALGAIEVVPRVWYNPDLKSRWFYVPAVLAMILMIMTMILSAMGVVR